jgi:5-methylthioadenosine/S-adenosylhomocysteine deaminase
VALVLIGEVISFEPSSQAMMDAVIYIGDDGIIEAVQAGTDPPPGGYETAPVLETAGTIYPGLIDLHNHLAYNCLSLWIPPRSEPYTRKDQWSREDSYGPQISAPANALGLAAGKAALKYVETKAVVGGVTAIQGSTKLSRPYEGWLVRNVEFETFGTKKKSVYQSVLPLGGDDYSTYRTHMGEGKAFIYHLSEGTSPSLIDQYTDLRDHDCLSPRLVGVHATALGAAEFEEWGPVGGSVVWSPMSNLWLYGATTDVVTAHSAGLNVCLGADWGPSGSKSVLGELKVADLCNKTLFDGEFTARQLCEMVTVNPARAVGWSERIGGVATGLLADLVVVARRDDDPYGNLIRSTERDVRLVLVGGRPVYGTGVLMRAASVPFAEPIYVAGIKRTISLIDPDVADADMSWSQVTRELELARAEPEAVHAAAAAAGEEPLRLIPDMPEDDLPIELALQSLGEVRIPPIDTLWHDAAFFRAIDRAPIHGDALSELRAYYER